MTTSIRHVGWLLPVAAFIVLPARANAQIIIGYGDPWGLHGAAAVIRAQGQFAKDMMQAAVIREKARQEMVKTRRARLEQYLWERKEMPTTEDERQRGIKEAEKRAANIPNLNEIWSGDALNRLILGLQKVPSDVLLADTTPIDPEYLLRLNVNTGFDSANIGLIRNFQQGKGLPWPRALQREEFNPARERTEIDLKTLIDAVRSSKPSGELFTGLERGVAQMKKDVVQLQKDSMIDHRLAISCYGFLSELNNALVALEKRDAADYLSRYMAQGKTAGELAHYMVSHGLRFTVMNPGNESAYTAVHFALAALYRKVVDNPVK